MTPEMTLAMAALARAAPNEWEEFKKAFRQYENAARDTLVKTQVDISRFQGMALQCSLLATAQDEAKQAADRITATQQAAKVRN